MKGQKYENEKKKKKILDVHFFYKNYSFQFPDLEKKGRFEKWKGNTSRL